MTKAVFTISVCGALLWVSAALAATDEERCLAGRVKAKGKYEKCVADQLSKTYGNSFAEFTVFQEKLAKCRIKYASTWTKLQGLSGSVTCGGQPRYADNGNGTITDNLTGLVWEKKSYNGDVHDRDATMTWSLGPPYNGDGTAFTSFLAVDPTGLNEVGFAGANDWRLPTFAELQTILLPEPYPCATIPCVDVVFNTGCTPGCSVTTCSCTQLNNYWSTTTFANNPSFAWYVYFFTNHADFRYKYAPQYVRAVRGGS